VTTVPTLPASLADRAERWFGHPVTVTAAESLSPNLRRITFSGEAMRDRSWRPGDEVQFRVADRHLRHYTPSRFDGRNGIFEIITFIRPGGPGSTWAAGLRPGSRVSVIGPNSGLRFRADHHQPLLVGDATAIGLFQALTQASAGRPPAGTIEVPAADRTATTEMTPHLTVLTEGTEPGDALLAWARDFTDTAARRAYLAGHAQTLQRLRTILRTRGIARDRIATKAFWATGRTGL
jgi:NADPH-dependent ferric siderophore reductase